MAYLKQEFMKYLHDIKGNGQPGVYCNGLDNVEKLFLVSIDAEFENDRCVSLYDRIQQMRKTPEQIGKNEHTVRQYASNVKRYVEFRDWQLNPPQIQTNTETEIPWVPFYTELADKLLIYKANRKELLEKLDHLFKAIGVKNPFMEKDIPMSDVDPFTVFGCFNKGITTANRIRISKGFQQEFALESDVPTNFDGIPVLNNLMAVFFAFKNDPRRGEHDIDNLWELFDCALDLADNWTSDNEKRFIEYFDTALKQFGVRWNITMALYWIRPYDFINLDDRNRQYLAMGKAFPPIDTAIASQLKNVPSGTKYLEIIKELKQSIKQHGSSKNINSFIDLSHNAWLATTGEKAEQLVSGEYWPSLDEYNPNITKEQWIEYLTTVEIPKHPCPMAMLRGLMEFNEEAEATCKQLANKYGGTPSRFIGNAVNLGKRAKKYFNLPPCIDEGKERYFPVAFLGRRVKENGAENYAYRIRPELYEALQTLDLSAFDPYDTAEENSDDTFENTMIDSKTDVPLNTILYGPPGTGKTYHTVIYAVAIVENKKLEDVAAEPYDDVFKRFNQYKSEELISFSTFHQSYGYEEFIEGIKPIVDGTNGIEYSVEDGVFKAFCAHAQLPQTHDINPDAKIWRVVLKNGNLVTSNSVKFDCFNENKIAFNWNAQEDHVGTYNYNQITHFRERINIGDVVVSYAGNGTDIDRIGVVTGDAMYDEKLHSYKWSRSVKWLDWIHPQHPINIKELNGNKYFDNDMLQQLKRVSLSELIKLLRPNGVTVTGKNHVFIIDEINRGNISKVFGELITLIEPSKRIGAAEELTTVLPCSQQPFGVPNNVYIIGTMNTADRSIAAIDTALRRRFQFREMMPDADVLAGITLDGISVSEMLIRMNKRIEVLYDREHTIGHAYFMPLKDSPTIETMAAIFTDRIIPLLQEYFYEDYEKIRLVLGDNRKTDESEMFITKKQNSYAELFGTMDLDLDEGFIYEINKAAFSNITSYKTI